MLTPQAYTRFDINATPTPFTPQKKANGAAAAQERTVLADATIPPIPRLAPARRRV